MTPDGATPTKTARLRIWRGTDREHGRYEEFSVPYEDGDSVLDGLVRIRLNDDPGLAVRFSCFNANVCKECTMLIDGNMVPASYFNVGGMLLMRLNRPSRPGAI